MKQCKGCQRLTRTGHCKVMKEKLDECWAWTNDPDWDIKVAAQVKEYRKYKKGEIGPFWRG